MYNFHSSTEVREHENLDRDTIQHCNALLHGKFYFRLSYMWKRFWRDLRMGQLFAYIKAVLSND